MISAKFSELVTSCQQLALEAARIDTMEEGMEDIVHTILSEPIFDHFTKDEDGIETLKQAFLDSDLDNNGQMDLNEFAAFLEGYWLQILESRYFNFHFDFAEGQNTKISAKYQNSVKYGCILIFSILFWQNSRNNS